MRELNRIHRVNRATYQGGIWLDGYLMGLQKAIDVVRDAAVSRPASTAKGKRARK